MARARVLVVEDDPNWINLIWEILAERRVAGHFSPSPEHAECEFSLHATSLSGVILDVGLFDLSDRLDPVGHFLEQLVGAHFGGPVLLISGFFTLPDMRSMLPRGLELDIRLATKTGEADDEVERLARLVDGFDVPRDEAPCESSLEREWHALCNKVPDPDGTRLENAVSGLLLGSALFHEVRQRVRRSVSEIDLVAIRHPTLALAHDDVLFVECRNRKDTVAAKDVRDLAGKMADSHVDFGLFISRLGFSQRPGSGASAFEASRELYIRDKKCIISLDFPTCLQIAAGNLPLDTALHNGALAIRLGLKQ